MRIALTGNPNSGKTTMYNELTGSSEKVGNWAGVTVDKNEHLIKKIYSGENKLVAVDLPGAYSMSPFTSEESITSHYVKNENPDVIINIVDATNLSRSLFFTTQLLELGIPVVVALNKCDVNSKKGTVVDADKLSDFLMCPVVETISVSAGGLKELIDVAVKRVGESQLAVYSPSEINESNRNEVREADRKRFKYVNSIVKKVEKRKIQSREINVSDKIDKLLTNRWLGIPLFAIVMWLVFQISQVWVGTPVADYLVGWIEEFQMWTGEKLSGADPLLSALLVDGIIGGVGAVVGFLPLVMVMYFLIALLEDCGYMSRVAVVLDPVFKKVGLSGKSVIPFVISIGCAVPGVMASRTIRDNRERRSAAMLAPFMPCGAKIPVIALFAGAFFDDAGWVSTVMYLSGIALIFIGALLVNKITGFKAKKSYFIIEIPEYKIPGIWNAIKSMCGRGREYVVKAATIILICNTVVQIMQSFTWSFEFIDYSGIEETLVNAGAGREVINAALADAANTSILSSIAGPVSYILIPVIGIASWQLAAAAVTGFIAKENVVGTIATCYGITNLINGDLEVVGDAADVGGVMGITSVAALAYLVFNLFSPPCFAAIGAMNAEMKSKKWLWGGIALQLAVGFIAGYMVYTIGTLLTDSSALDISAAVAGLIAVVLIVIITSAIIVNNNKQVKNCVSKK